MHALELGTRTRADARRVFAFIVLAALSLSMIALPADARGGPPSRDTTIAGWEVPWEGNGTDSVAACTADELEFLEELGEGFEDGYLHWILTPGGPFTITNASLQIWEPANGAEVDESPFSGATQGGPNGAVHFYTPAYGELVWDEVTNEPLYLDPESLSALATADFSTNGGGTPDNALLTISNGCFDPGLVVDARISGTKWLDRSDDGLVDPSDSAIAGWTVSIYKINGELAHLEDVVTDSNGEWSYETGTLSSPSIDLLVCEEQPDGWGSNDPAATLPDGVTLVTDATFEGDDLGTCYRVTLDVDDPDYEELLSGIEEFDHDFFNLAPLEAEKTADTSYTTTYEWDIDKTADEDEITFELDGPDSIDVEYTVTVSNTGSTDSGHTISGSIEITNDSGQDGAVIDDIVDTLKFEDEFGDPAGELEADVTCYDDADEPLATFVGVELDDGDTLNCTYSASVDGEVEGTNHVEVSASNGFLDVEATATWNWDDADVTELDECLTVSDTMVGADLTPDTVCLDDLDEDGEYSWNYTITFDRDDYECGTQDIENTARFVTNDTEATGSDQHTVTIEVECLLEGCTPGFWRQDQHFQYWVGFNPADSYQEAFGLAELGAGHVTDKTLLEAVWEGGAPEGRLLRHSTAALLNASSSEVAYPYSVAQVISMTYDAWTGGDLDSAADAFVAANEEGCPH